MNKIKTNKLLLSGDSWMANKTNWFDEIFDYNEYVNLSVRGSGNKWIAESIISYILDNQDVDYVFVNWSGLNRVDIPLPLITPDLGESKQRTTSTTKYWTNIMAPWRDKESKIHIEEKIIRMMYQEKGYTSVKNQSLLNIVALQDFLKNRNIDYLFCFAYDYTNTDFEHNHLTGESTTENFSTMGTIAKDNVLFKEIDMEFCLTPAGIDWGLQQDTNVFKDAAHLTDNGYKAWAKHMLNSHT